MSGRHLSAEERALWARVASGIRRANRDAERSPVTVEEQKAEPGAGSPQNAKPPGIGRSKPDVSRAHRPVKSTAAPSNTLDGAWDRRLATGVVVPDMSIDLHGCTLDAAHSRLDHGLARAIAEGCRIVLLITGKAPRAGTSRLDTPLRGIIRASVGDWLAASPHTRQIAAIRAAHPRHGGPGALYIVLRRVRS